MARTPKQYARLEVVLGDADGLTVRQKEIAFWMGKGLKNTEIADQLGISIYTVNDHMETLQDRFGAYSRQDLQSQFFLHRILEARAMVIAFCMLCGFLSMMPCSRPVTRLAKSGPAREARVSQGSRKEIDLTVVGGVLS